LTPEALPAVMVPGWAHKGLQLGEPLSRRVGPQMLVVAHRDRPSLAAWYDNRLDFFREKSCALRLAARCCERSANASWSFPRDLIILGDVLRRLRHGVDGRTAASSAD